MTIQSSPSPSTESSARWLALALLSLSTLPLTSCSVWDVTGLIVDPNTEVSFTIRSGSDLDGAALESDLLDRFGVSAAIEVLDTGTTMIKLFGLYEHVVEATKWMLFTGLELLAHDEVAETILTVAVSLMK